MQATVGDRGADLQSFQKGERAARSGGKIHSS
jgi:hypothetical protein